MPMRRLLRLRGVGNKTRREIAASVKILRAKLGNPPSEGTPLVGEAQPSDNVAEQATEDISKLSVDLLVQRLTRSNPREGDKVRKMVMSLLGLEESLPDNWPSQAAVARFLGVTRARTGQVFTKAIERWSRDKAVTSLRDDTAGLLKSAGGVMTAVELGEALLAARGSIQESSVRTRLGNAAARAAVEVERTLAEPRFLVRRDDTRTLVALHLALADYGALLGDRADVLAREDPLASPARALQMLREITAPLGFEPLPDSRLLRLAVASSREAASFQPARDISSRHGGVAGAQASTGSTGRCENPHARANPRSRGQPVS